jgi:hypothetical protein
MGAFSQDDEEVVNIVTPPIITQKTNAPIATAQEQSTPNYSGGFFTSRAVPAALGLVHGGTFGLDQRFMAGLSSPFAYGGIKTAEMINSNAPQSVGLPENYGIGDVYDLQLRKAQGMLSQAREEYPLTTAGAEITGSVAGLGKLAKSAGGILQKGGEIARGVLGNTGAKVAAVPASFVGGEAAFRGYQAAESPPGAIPETLAKPSEILGVPYAGGIISSVVPALSAGNAVLKQVGKATTPTLRDSAPEIIDMAGKYNIKVGLDDLTDDEGYQTLISEAQKLPFTKGVNKRDEVINSFQQAVYKQAGINAEKATPAVINQAYEKMGKEFEGFTKNKKFELPESYYSKIEEIRDAASKGIYGDKGADFVENYQKEIENLFEAGKAPGKRLDTLRRKYAKTSRKGNENSRMLASDFEEVVADIITGTKKGAKEALSDLKSRYKSLKTIQRLTLDDQFEGTISPAKLMNSVVKSYGEDAVVRGKAGPLGELAQLGKVLKLDIPNSGTSQRTFAKGLLTGDMPGAIGAAATTAATYPILGPLAPLAGAAQLGGSVALRRNVLSKNYDEKLIKELVKKQTQKSLPKSMPAQIAKKTKKVK